MNTHSNSVDHNFLQGVISITNDGSSAKKPPYLYEYAGAKAKIDDRIKQTCNSERIYDQCSEYFNSELSCVEYFSKRYSKVLAHMDDVLDKYASRFKHVNVIKSYAKEDFGVDVNNLYIVGESSYDYRYNVEPHFRNLKLNNDQGKMFFEWIGGDHRSVSLANYFAQREYELLFNQPIPKIEKGEFEKTENYEKRLKVIEDAHRKEMQNLLSRKDSLYSSILLNNINSVLGFEGRWMSSFPIRSINYDADKEEFVLEFLTKASDRIEGNIGVPISKAPEFKKWYNALNFEQKRIYLLFVRNESAMDLVGGYLYTEELTLDKLKNRPYIVKFQQGLWQRIPIGKNAADDFEKDLLLKLDQIRTDQQKQAASESAKNREAACEMIKYHPFSSLQAYYAAMRYNGCF